MGTLFFPARFTPRSSATYLGTRRPPPGAHPTCAPREGHARAPAPSQGRPTRRCLGRRQRGVRVEDVFGDLPSAVALATPYLDVLALVIGGAGNLQLVLAHGGTEVRGLVHGRHLDRQLRLGGSELLDEALDGAATLNDVAVAVQRPGILLVQLGDS